MKLKIIDKIAMFTGCILWVYLYEMRLEYTILYLIGTAAIGVFYLQLALRFGCWYFWQRKSKNYNFKKGLKWK